MSIEADILQVGKTVAVVGLSNDESRPSNRVAKYLQQNGYKIIPVNPTADEILGEKCYPNLYEIKEPVDIVDIFRRSDAVLPIVEEAISISAKAVWMQEGVVNDEAAQLALNAGLLVTMDKCMLKEHVKIK